ncbi:DUF4238 domain-containing protein [Curtobacterium sp. MCBD17_034]|uniref:DUF4238 domain-containing protein n=1 Tax=unclassified Curtobacterium TaxID=257496 RepID=UPI0035CC615A
MPLDHYLPASFIAQFSQEDTYPSRLRRVAVQREKKKAYLARAERIGAENNLYSSGSSGRVVDIDSTWTRIENDLPKVVARLQSGFAPSAHEWLRVLVPFVAMTFIRGREYEGRYVDRLDAFLGSASEAFRAEFQDKGQINLARMEDLEMLLPGVTCARWVFSSTAGSACITNDLGLVGTIDTDSGKPGWTLPLSPAIVVSIFPRSRRQVLEWDGNQWKPLLADVPMAPDRLQALKEALARAAREFVVGPTIESVEEYQSIIGKGQDHREMMEAWPRWRTSRSAYSLVWHRLAALVAANTPPDELVEGTLPPEIDWSLLSGGWIPPLMTVLDEGIGLSRQGDMILLNIDVGSSFGQ